jgi:hypothetical protein
VVAGLLITRPQRVTVTRPHGVSAATALPCP